MITYTLKKNGEIECTGYTSKFTLDQLKDQINNRETTLKELSANVKLKEAMVNNIVEHNSFIKKLTPEMIHACFMYHEAKIEHMAFSQNITKLKSAIRKDGLELKEILKQIPELDDTDK